MQLWYKVAISYEFVYDVNEYRVCVQLSEKLPNDALNEDARVFLSNTKTTIFNFLILVTGVVSMCIFRNMLSRTM